MAEPQHVATTAAWGTIALLEPGVAEAYFQEKTVDDVMRRVYTAILTDGEHIDPTKKGASELRGVLIEITDPRARLSRTETRGKPFSCLGELCWYLAKDDSIDFISYYIPDYRTYADGDTIFGAYGPRLFNWRGVDQVGRVIKILQDKRDSRQAVIQLFDAGDLNEKHNDVPCTCTLQFFLRDGKLDMFTSMRSNDAYLGMPHDIFAFTMLQEIVARSVSAELGKYTHAVGSLHIYDRQTEEAREYIDEGWQATTPMPRMPEGDPWNALSVLSDAEAALRVKGSLAEVTLTELDPYWRDLIRLLHVFRSWKDKNTREIEALRDEMHSEVYKPFIDQRLSRTR